VKTTAKSKKEDTMKRNALRKCLPAVMSLALLGGCQTGTGGFSGLGFDGTDWFSSSEQGETTSIVLARDPAMLANGSAIERALYNAVELTQQKRFQEARHLLSDARGTQLPSSDGYRAITCAMAVLSLKEGDLATFKRVARQLDLSLGKPINVDERYVEVITLYRTFAQESLPVNAPAPMRRFKDRYFGQVVSAEGSGA
jgi:hypothetical protein